jgi:RHS repeat-associated protein
MITLASVSAGGITQATYIYDANEQLAIRDSLVAPAGVTHYVHDIFGNIIAETAGGGATGATGTVREYIWLYETEIAPTSGSRTTIDRPLAVVNAVNTASPAAWWVSVDHLNRPVKMTNAAKLEVWNAVWQPWGAAQSITGTATLNARFPGQWFQVEAGLHYNWHRHYDPTLGRYTQPDPLGFVDGPSVYGYVRGSPHRFVDPDGRNAALLPWCLANPALCAIILTPPAIVTCYGMYKNWSGSSGGGGSGGEDEGSDDDNRCEEQDRADRVCCMSQIILKRRAKCHDQATERTHACNNKRYIPSLGFCGR